jgi:HAE1 family hydrophobic/amphiphilic exporter-1
MLAATSLAIFIVPVLFVLISKLSYSKKQLAYLQSHHEDLVELEEEVAELHVDEAVRLDIMETEKEKEEREKREKEKGKDDQK